MLNMHFVEIISNDHQSAVEYARYRFFINDDDYLKIQDLIMLEDNIIHQCRSNSRACFFSDDSFTNLIKLFYFVEEIYDLEGKQKAVHEGSQINGKRDGLMRISDRESVVLEWFTADFQNGKSIYKYLDSESKCYKDVRIIREEENGDIYKEEYPFEGQDMTVPMPS